MNEIGDTKYAIVLQAGHAMHAGTHVQGSPFHCTVVPGEADAASSQLYGPGLQAIQLGKPSSLFLQLADQWGNTATAVDLTSANITVGPLLTITLLVEQDKP